MTIKHTPNVKQFNIQNQSKSLARKSPFKFSSAQSSALAPTYVPLQFTNLKASTRYKIFIQTNTETNTQEDITSFCRPYGESVRYNNNQTVWDYFTTSPSGELTVFARPFGTESVLPSTNNWSDFWKYGQKSSYSSSANRGDFLIVEYSKVAASDRADTSISQKQLNVSVPSITITQQEQTTEDLFIKQSIAPNYVQTFFVDPNSVNNANFIDLTDVTLYFRKKPDRTNNSSGITNPGVTIAIIDVEDDTPNVSRQYKNSFVRKTWSEVAVTSDASAATVFPFEDSVRLETGKSYGIVLLFDDSEFFPWQCITGDLLVGTNTSASGPQKNHRGSLFLLTNSAETITNDNFNTLYVSKADRDLKFDINVAEYDLSSNVVIDVVNRDMEFFTLEPNAGNWFGDEFVYQDTTAETGTITVSPGSREINGSGTSFADTLNGEFIVLRDSNDSSKTEVVQVERVETATKLFVAEPIILSFNPGVYLRTPVANVHRYKPETRELELNKSTARDGFTFTANSTIIGNESNQSAEISSIDVFPVSVFSSNFELDLPAEFELNSYYNFTVETSPGVYEISELNKPLDLLNPNYVTDYNALILSRSTEVDNGENLFDAGLVTNTANTIAGEVERKKSMQLRLEFSPTGATKTYESPELTISRITAVTNSWLINSDATDEHTNDGTAITKYISRKLVFQQGREAEDIRVILNGYRPRSTDIKVYAKILNNSDDAPFDDKNWTELVYTSGESSFSDPRDQFDYREYEFGFPSTIETSEVLDGKVTTTNASATVTGSSTTFSDDLEDGDIIKISDPLFEQNFGIFSIDTVVNNTELTLTEPVTNANIISDGLIVSKLETPQTAFNNPLNSGIVRYFDEAGAPHDGYSTVAVKIVLLADSSRLVPKVDDYRVVGVSV